MAFSRRLVSEPTTGETQLPSRARLVSKSPTERVFRIEVKTQGETTFSIRAIATRQTSDGASSPRTDQHQAWFAYAVEPNWNKPTTRVTVTAEFAASRPMLSVSYEHWMLTPSIPAAAFRVEWGKTADRVGALSNYVVLTGDRLFLGWGSCSQSLMSFNADFDDLGFVRVTPLFADGSVGLPSDVIRLRKPPQSLRF
jgi:hypothetical protein